MEYTSEWTITRIKKKIICDDFGAAERALVVFSYVCAIFIVLCVKICYLWLNFEFVKRATKKRSDQITKCRNYFFAGYCVICCNINRTVFSICIYSFVSQSNPVNFAFFPPVKSVLINKFSWTHTHNLQESFCVLFSHNNSKKVHWMQENNNFFYGWQWCSEIWLGLYVHCRITQPKLNLNWNRVCSNASRILTMSLNNYCV